LIKLIVKVNNFAVLLLSQKLLIFMNYHNYHWLAT